jgi:hypothetical protein
MSTPTEIVRRWCVSGRLPGAKEYQTGWKIPARSLSFFCGRKLEQHYDVPSAAALICKSESTIRAWIADGSLKHRKTGTSKSDSVLIPESELARRIGA